MRQVAARRRPVARTWRCIADRAARPADRCRAHVGRPGSRRGAGLPPGSRLHPAGRLPIRWAVAAAPPTAVQPSSWAASLLLCTRFRRSAMIPGGAEGDSPYMERRMSELATLHPYDPAFVTQFVAAVKGDLTADELLPKAPAGGG